MKRFVRSLAVAGFLAGFSAAAQAGDVVIENGKTVQLDYTVRVDGEVVDTSEGKEPMEYVHGGGSIIPGLEKRLTGLKVGDKKTVTVPADEAYGQPNPEAIQEAPKSLFPANVTIEKGMVVPLQTKEGQQVPAIVQEIKGDTVVLDFNHPMAGKQLVFDITVVAIR
ncbi:MAG: peptidylprolyl isomerase [Candidatus Omnitrophota bacterium]|nr:peptidylprolyl isomerase [Candidatus Omnitrophota bacterium]MDZ4242504.1 peptidylprolyl isomerase [Candidatus Omnitrophota bacterium]